MKKAELLGPLVVLLGLTGCGRQLTWIDVWHGMDYPVDYYIVKNTKVPASDIGELYEILDTTNHAYPVTSNRLPQGTKVFVIRGENPSKELAVEIGPENFVEAIDSGTQKP